MSLAYSFVENTDAVPILDGLGILAVDVEDQLGPSGGYYGVYIDPDSEEASLDMEGLESPVDVDDKTGVD